MKIALALLLMIGLWGCNQKSVDPDVDKLGRATGPSAGAPQGIPSPMTPPPAVTPKVHKGKILEVLDVPRYTYIRFEDAAAKEWWAAVPTIEVKKDQEVTVLEQMTMANFKSESLNRTFETVIFGTLEGQKSSGIGGMGGMGGKMPAGHPPVDGTGGEPGAQPGKQGMPAGHPPIGGEPKGGAKLPEGHPPVGEPAKNVQKI